MGRRFSVSLQTGPGAHQASYTMSTRLLPVLKRLSHCVNHHLQIVQTLNKEYSYTQPLCLHGMLQGEFYLSPSHKPMYSMVLGRVSSPLCVYELRLACSLTQLCQYRCIYWLCRTQNTSKYHDAYTQNQETLEQTYIYTKTLHHHTHTHISTRRQQIIPTPSNPFRRRTQVQPRTPEATN